MQRSSFIAPWRTLSQRQFALVDHRNLDISVIHFGLSSRGQISPTSYASTTSIISASSTDAEVLSSQDILVGTILAFILAFGYSYLNGQSSSTSFVSWRSHQQLSYADDASELLSDETKSTVFNETNWKEMSRTENYILYNTRIREKQQSNQTPQSESKDGSSRGENKMVFVALLALFIPIFSIEMFFALSRQFLCEGGLFSEDIAGEFAERLCSPIQREM